MQPQIITLFTSISLRAGYNNLEQTKTQSRMSLIHEKERSRFEKHIGCSIDACTSSTTKSKYISLLKGR
ncbi:hypothetical protein BJY01DRAFT_207621 [Aspergillus pseudoustus]|uniref:Uncharacterized protein n=1 Tax=Aspergillus pseudoustus TaxID=1810923 RepID=A0ABR4KKJ3_9EURO